MLVADVDHGSDTATATIRPSEMRTSFARAAGSAIEIPAIPYPAVMAIAAAAYIEENPCCLQISSRPMIAESSVGANAGQSRMPRVQIRGCEFAVIAPHAGARQANEDIDDGDDANQLAHGVSSEYI
jgi:hypothetical protein